jgi:hypothetical protein
LFSSAVQFKVRVNGAEVLVTDGVMTRNRCASEVGQIEG